MHKETLDRNIEDIIKGIAKLYPVSKSISPKGSDVAIQNEDGSVLVTKDGNKIRNSIHSQDPLEEVIIRIIKDSADRTHKLVGDARSSTIAMSSMLSIEMLKLINSGYNHRDIANELNSFKDKYLKEIRKLKIPSKKSDLFHVAKISANNDEEIAKNTIEAIDVIGEYGMAFIDTNPNGTETILEKELGFNIASPIPYEELLLDKDIFHVIYKDVPVLITDKRLYYRDEAENIIATVKEAGYNSMVIVAREFIKGSEALVALTDNHTSGNMKVCLITDPNVSDTDTETLYDLSAYMNGKVISERGGDLVENITIKDFCIAKKVYQDTQKALITPIKGGKGLNKRIKSIKDLIKNKKTDKLERRLASLTTGNVNLFIGGSTIHEFQEKMDCYQDAINATRRAMTDGFVVGGGVTLLKAFKPSMVNSEYRHILKKYSETIIRQIAENCNKHTDTVVNVVRANKNKHFGYNALTDKYEDLLLAGVLEPLKAIEMVVENSISTAITLTSISTFIINKEEKTNENDKK